MTLDTAITLAGTGLLAALCLVLAGRRIFSTSPAFLLYLSFDLVSCVAGELVLHFFAGWYVRFFVLEATLDLLLYFCVLAEIGKNLLRYNRETPSQLPAVVPLFAAAALFACLLTRWAPLPGNPLLSNIYILAMRAIEFLQFTGFLTLVWWSSLRKLSWPRREFRVATGFGFITFVWFVIALLHAWFSAGAWYHWLDQAGQAADLVVFAYWLHHFWIEADREPAARSAHAESAFIRDRKSIDRTQRLGWRGAVIQALRQHTLTRMFASGCNRSSGEGVHL